MGFVPVKVGLENVVSSASRCEAELLVDTGALYSMVPAPLLREVGVTPRHRLSFDLANGTTAERDDGEVNFVVDGRDALSPVILGEETNATVLGVVILEAMGMEVAPLRGQIRPARLILY